MRRPKTTRRWGMWAMIRRFAAAHPTFVTDDLCPPLTRVQAQTNCRELANRGELRLVTPGVGGRPGYRNKHRPPRYAKP